MSEELSENSEMSALVEASSLVRSLAEPCPAGDSVKAAIRRSARKLHGWRVSRVKDLWYADPRVSVRGDELNELRAADRAKKREQEAKDGYRQMLSRIARLEQMLCVSGQDFDGDQADASRDMDGAADRAVD